MARLLAIDLGSHAVKVTVFRNVSRQWTLEGRWDQRVEQSGAVPALDERLAALERTMAREIARAIPEVLGETPAPPDFPARLATVLAAMRGLALTQAYEPRSRRGADPWPTIRPFLEQILLD